MEVQDLVEAQVTEALIEALYLMVRYEHFLARSELEFVVGKELDHSVFGGA